MPTGECHQRFNNKHAPTKQPDSAALSHEQANDVQGFIDAASTRNKM
jgi:hypothetical protein